MRLKRMMIMLAVLLLAACPALAETTMHREVSGGAVELTDVSIGYDGVTTYDRAMPVRATVKNQGGDRTGVLAVNVYVDSEQYDRCEIPLTLPAGAERQVTIPIRSYYKQEQYTVEWVENGIVTAARTAAAGKVIDPSTLLVGLLSNDPNSLSYLNIGKSNDTLRRGEMWQTVALSAADLPTDDGLLSSFAMLVIDQFDATSLSAKQMEALGRWLNSGGILALGGGADAAFLYPAFYEWTGLTPAR